MKLSRQVNTALGRLGPLWATCVLTSAAVVAALGTLCVIEAAGGPPVTWLVIFIASAVTVVVAAPIILYSQHMIGRLRTSRRALKEMTSQLALAVDHAEQANRAKTTFLANMSHELRTPLNAIIGFSEIIRDQHMGPIGSARYQSYAGDIHNSGTHLLKIINDVLDLSKIEAGKMSIDDAEAFDLQDVSAAALRIVQPMAERAQVSLAAQFASDNVRLFAVRRMVQQILINLLTNAVKFTARAGHVRLTGALNSDGSFSLAVHDSGVGMTPGEVARALVPFGQIENVMSRKHSGTGLGLPLSKALIELHGGSLHIHSVPQLGTEVSVTFPAHRVTPNEVPAQLHAAR